MIGWGRFIRQLTGKGHREAQAEQNYRESTLRFQDGMATAGTYLSVSEKLVRQLQEDIPK